MATELVLLSDVPLTEEVHHRAYKRLGMTGQMLEWLDGRVFTLHDRTTPSHGACPRGDPRCPGSSGCAQGSARGVRAVE